MPQIASTLDKKPAEQVKASVNRAADIARDVSDKSSEIDSRGSRGDDGHGRAYG